MSRPGNLSDWALGRHQFFGQGGLRPGESSFMLFQPRALTSPDVPLTDVALQQQYGPLDLMQQRAVRQQMQVMGRPLTRAEQRGMAR